MNVVMAGYQAVTILRGGPNTQLRQTAKHLAAHGVTARLFDPWAPPATGDADLVHLFAANIGTYHLAREIHALGIPLVVSPIVYSLHSPRFIRTVLSGTRLLQRMGRGFWSDYALTADIAEWAEGLFPNTVAEGEVLTAGFGVPASKLTVIPNGVDERFAAATPDLFRKKYGLEHFILNVGHIGHERKNVLSLIRALGEIDHPAVIIGRIIRGNYGDACVREAAKYRRILLIDGLDTDSDLLASAYAACDVFVLPSLFETPGIAALEAGLAGAKVVITRHGGTIEYFRDMAQYVDPASISSIRDGILDALSRPNDGRLREHISARFLWPEVARQTAEAYRRILAR